MTGKSFYYEKITVAAGCLLFDLSGGGVPKKAPHRDCGSWDRIEYVFTGPDE